jgi:hypothetical protein
MFALYHCLIQQGHYIIKTRFCQQVKISFSNINKEQLFRYKNYINLYQNQNLLLNRYSIKTG